jgi:serine protease Do
VLDNLRRQKFLPFTLLLFTLCLGIVIGTLFNTRVSAARGQSAAPDASPLTIPSPVQLGNEFTKLAHKLEPSVVNITAEFTPKESSATARPKGKSSDEDEEDQGGSGDENSQDFLHRFFRDPFGGANPNVTPRMFRREQSGTGFIVDKNGYILTNNHVIDHMDRIKVRLHGDTAEYRAKIIGTDVESDLAVIKIDPKSTLTQVTIGNSDAVQVGDWAVAIGSPFGLEASVTAGIVSATGRDIAGAQTFQRFIQTDAAINPGNSGGPLLNIRGDVIGVNTMIATQNGGYQGIGFALPMNMAVRVYNDIIREGKVTRGSIGIQWNKADKPDLLRALGETHGVLVQEVIKKGPAEKAGIKAEDIVLAINGKSVKDGDDLINRVADLPVGSPAVVTVDRSGKKMDFKLIVGNRAEVLSQSNPAYAKQQEREETPAPAPESAQAKFGISIRPLNDVEKESIASLAENGVKVTHVETGSFAEDVGLVGGDIIVSINRQPVTSVEGVKKVQTMLRPGSPVAFRILRSQTPNARGRNAQWFGTFLSGTLPGQ